MTGTPDKPEEIIWPDDMAGRLAIAIGTGAMMPPDPVEGCALMLPGGWPSFLVEVGVGGIEDMHSVGGHLVGTDMVLGRLHDAGMRPAADMYTPPEADGPLRWIVQRRDNARGASGIYGPGKDGPRGFALISPLPPWPAEFDYVVPTVGYQVGVYATTRTTGIIRLSGPALREAVAAEAAAGRLYGVRAAVV